jgi:hypothetical protein
MPEIELALAALALAEKLYPKIEEAIERGEVSDEQALALHQRVDALHSRKRWKPAPTPPHAPPIHED